MTITVFSKEKCPRCKMVKKFFNDKNIKFTERRREDFPEDVEFLKSKGFTSYPITVIEEVNLTIQGFDIKKLKEIEGELLND